MGAAGSGGGAGFTISPSVGGVSDWVFADDGDLILGSGSNGAAGLSYEITVSSSFSVNIDMWGGGAASGWWYVSSSGSGGSGGGGGHTTADVVLNAGTYTIHVGGGGKSFPVYSTGPSSPSRADYRSGGCPLTWGTEGAGYSGLFKTSSISQANAMLIAGGGGGGGSSPYGGVGGAGGGASGASTNGGAQGGYGGTQSSGGSPSPYNSATGGSALSGGTSQTYGYSSLGGGGGGYYGGGGGNVGGGGGGSGYIDTSDSDITNEVTTAGSANVPGDSSNSRRSGNGSPGAGGTAGQGHSGLVYMSAN